MEASHLRNPHQNVTKVDVEWVMGKAFPLVGDLGPLILQAEQH